MGRSNEIKFLKHPPRTAECRKLSIIQVKVPFNDHEGNAEDITPYPQLTGWRFKSGSQHPKEAE